MPRTAPRYTNLAEIIENLGGIDPRRIRASPPPGEATEKDLLALLDRQDLPVELVDGILVEKIMGYTESVLAMFIGRVIGNWVEEHDLGCVTGEAGTMRLMPKLVRIPEVAFVSWQQLPKREYPSKPIPDLYPDLAVEVLSEGNTRAEIQRKLKEYFLAGSRLVWVVDPDEFIVRVHTSPDDPITLGEKDTLDGGEVLPGFRLSLKELFARVPRPKKKRSLAERKKSR